MGPDTTEQGDTRIEPGQGASASLVTCAVLGQYRIIRLLGRGGMGEVYEVEHTTLGRRYALKLLPQDFADRPGALERFRREARVMANLEHANIVRVDDFGETGGRYWLRMELAEGVELEAAGETSHVISLGELADAGGGKIPQGLLLPILRQVLAGLCYAHEHGAVHRDLKPSNILLAASASPEGFIARISDFGLVRLVGEEWVRSQAEISVRESVSVGERETMGGEAEGTSTRSLLGTYEYMSPEQKRGEEADARSDLYSFGLMCFRLLTGKSIGLKLPTQIDKSLVSGWDRIVSGLIDDDPADRPDGCALVLPMFDAVSTEIAELAQARREEAEAQEHARRAAIVAEKRRIEERRKEREARERARREEEHGARTWERGEAEEKRLLLRQHPRQAALAPAPEVRHKPDRLKWAVLSLLATGLLAGLAAALYMTQERTTASRRRVAVPSAPPPASSKPVAVRQAGQHAAPTTTTPYADKQPAPEPPKAQIPEDDPPQAPKPSKTAPPRPAESTPVAPLKEPHTHLRVRSISVRVLSLRFDGKVKLPTGKHKFQVNHAIGDQRRSYFVELNQVVGKTGFVVERYEEKIATVADPRLGRVKKDVSILYLKSGDKTVGLTYKESTPWREFSAVLHLDKGAGQEMTFKLGMDSTFELGKDKYEVVDIDADTQTVTIRRERDAAQFRVGKSSVVSVDREPGGTAKSPLPGKAWASAATDMEFVWLAKAGVWFGKYEVTNAEYRKFKRDHDSGEYEGHTLNGDRQPVVNVSWEDAKAFCKWLTAEDRRQGRLSTGWAYRLPYDWEWSVAVGLDEARAGSPGDKSGKIEGVYPWGKEWPPPRGAGNYSGSESESGLRIEGYSDEYPVTAPVGSFVANAHGLYDLSGNVWEWCEDWYDPGEQKCRVLRGGSWLSFNPVLLLSSVRSGFHSVNRYGGNGFRVVLSRGSAR
jgi:serine/threonine protein kinase/formylglycine-generating enzyme required for sulfatase activity